MIIDRMIIDKFLLFKSNEESPSFNEDFSPGFNVFIGTNGTGKSTLLKCIYVACELSRTKENNLSPQNYFSSSKSLTFEEPGFYKIISGSHEFFYEFVGYGVGGYGVGPYGGSGGTPVNTDDPWRTLNINSILIPSSEMLSHSPGFLALNSRIDKIHFYHRCPSEDTLT